MHRCPAPCSANPALGREPRRLASAFSRLCIPREFDRFVLRQASPVTGWLRALGRHEHERCGGPGIGVVGMSLGS
jgi:hypothetical protein